MSAEAAVIGRDPAEIWKDSLEDGERRLARPASVLAATGLLGGYHVTLGLLALVVTTGALATVMPEVAAHALTAIAIVGNIAGGVILVALLRRVQAAPETAGSP